MAAALELLRRRFPAPPADARERDRALGILVRRGLRADLAFDALRRQRVEAEPEVGLPRRTRCAAGLRRGARVLRSGEAKDRPARATKHQQIALDPARDLTHEHP